MNADVLLEIVKGVVPAVAAALVACAVMALVRRGASAQDRRGWWVVVLALGVGCAVGGGWSGGTWMPGVSATSWLCAMALLAGASGLVRGEGEGAGAGRWVLRAAALAVAAWMTVRSVAVLSGTERTLIVAGLAVVGGAVCWGLERLPKDGEGVRGGWVSAATGLVLGFSTCQVLIVGMEVHTAAWMAAGVSAVFGVCLAAELVLRRGFVGRGLMTSAGVLLCGLMVHGSVLRDRASGVEVCVYALLLTLCAVGPAVVTRVLGERGRGWAGLAASAVPGIAAVVMAVIVRPPPLE